MGFSCSGFFVGFVLCGCLGQFWICGWFGFLWGRMCFFGWLDGFEEGGVPLRDQDPGSLFCPGRLFSFQANKRVQLSLRSGRI